MERRIGTNLLRGGAAGPGKHLRQGGNEVAQTAGAWDAKNVFLVCPSVAPEQVFQGTSSSSAMFLKHLAQF